jgi:hypothetical protein
MTVKKKAAKGAKAKKAKASKPKRPAPKPKAAKSAPKKGAKPAKAAKKAPAAKGKATAKKGKKAASAETRIVRPIEPIIHDDRPQAPPLKRKLGLRGAAPWAARHAAKHAAEARARAAEPAPPGSARATIRTPSGAEQIKARVAELFQLVQRIRTLRKRLDKGFYEIGEVLADIQARELHLAKGYGTFEAFLEREVDLGKQTALRLIKVIAVFQREPSLDYGLDRVLAGLSALEGEVVGPASHPSVPSAPGSRPGLPLKPPMRFAP